MANDREDRWLTVVPGKELDPIIDRGESVQKPFEKEFIHEQVGDLTELVREMKDFDMSLETLCSNYGQILKEYPNQWVAIHQGEVKASAETHELLMAEVEQKGLPRHNVLIRFLDKTGRKLIV